LSNSDQTKELISYRLSQAEEMLKAAKTLTESQISPRSVVNRTYYAMFYSVLAILATINKGSGKHSGVISLFNMHFIKTGILPRDLGKVLHNAFELRQEADYGTDMIAVDNETALEISNDAETFVAFIRKYLSEIKYI
jgi:uncharacterized protein (UPF0332 family)